MSEYLNEPVPGLPAKLPPGETLLWQGQPDWRCLARRVFHVPLIAVYLGALALWSVGSAVFDGQPLADTISSASIMGLLIGACCAILTALAYATARTTVYSVSSDRVVMRYGIALPMALNLPFAKIETAAVKHHAGGCSDIVLTLAEGEKLPYTMLWPHARPWRVSRPEPMLRGVPEGLKAASVLAQVLAASAARPSARTKAAGPAMDERLDPAAEPPRLVPGTARPAPSGAASQPMARSA